MEPYYAASPIQLVSSQIHRWLHCDQCKTLDAEKGGPVTTFDLSTLGLVPPFQLQ
jgi:hypothetical protein